MTARATPLCIFCTASRARTRARARVCQPVTKPSTILDAEPLITLFGNKTATSLRSFSFLPPGPFRFTCGC